MVNFHGHKVLKAVSLIWTAVLISCVFYFQGIIREKTRQSDELRTNYTMRLHERERIDRLKNRRIDFFKKRYFMEFPGRYAYSTAMFVQRLLENASPAEMVFKSLKISPMEQNFVFSLEGFIRKDSKLSAGRILRDFCGRMQSYEKVIQIESPLTNGEEEEKPAGYGRMAETSADGTSPSWTTFILVGEVELE